MTTPTTEAIEAAARATCLMEYGVEWEHMGEGGRRSCREEATNVLSAAYPLMEASAKAEALREAADEYGPAQISGFFIGRDGYTKEWLRARAATIEGKES